MTGAMLSFQEVKKAQIPALDPSQVEDIRFLCYLPPPTDKSDSGLLEEWGDRIRFIVEDMHKLLQLSHEKFWCQAVFDVSLQSLIDTYLKNAPRCHDMIPVHDLSEDFQEQHAELHKLIFMTCLRLATHKEDKEHFIEPTVFGEMIFDNFIFDVPKLFDLCVLYAQENGQLLAKMIENIFSQQPKYNEDLCCVIPTVFKVLQEMRRKCGMPPKEGSKSPKKTSNVNIEEITAESISTSEIQDLIFYLADIGRTLSSFLEVYPPASQIFQQAAFIGNISEAYDLVPVLSAVINNREFESYTQKKLLRKKLAQAKKFLMFAVHLIITHCYVKPILENRCNLEEYVEGFIKTLSGMLNERQFLADFESCHPFQDYADILNQCPYDIDEKRIQHIQEAFSSAFATYGKRKKPTGATTRGGRTSPDGSPGPMEEVTVCGPVTMPAQLTNNTDNYDFMGACAPRKTEVELTSLIAGVKDLLPDLGDGFIELCLEEYDYDIEKVINSVLEDKLPPALQDVDKRMHRQQDKHFEDLVISQRANVFDHDEFDVFSRNKVDLTKVYKGKKGKTDTVDLDDNDLVALNPKLAEKYGYQMIEVEDMAYDDEYDDTYDTINVGADDADSADELSQRRQFTVPRVLQQRKDIVTDSDESSEESVEETPVKDEFVPDPALIRQRAEERAKLKAQRKKTPGQKSNFRGQKHEQEKKFDVKGEPKGQGQSEEVLRNRAWKAKHKHLGANHNRKYFSDKKKMAFGGSFK